MKKLFNPLVPIQKDRNFIPLVPYHIQGLYNPLIPITYYEKPQPIYFNDYTNNIPDQEQYRLDSCCEPQKLYPDEQFRVIDFYDIKPNMYYISSYGRVFSMLRKREMSYLDSKGYITVTLRTIHNNDNISLVHRLVAMAFIPKTQEDIELSRDLVNHKNLCKDDNHVWNLEWVTNEENTQHARDNDAYYHPFNSKYRVNKRGGGKSFGCRKGKEGEKISSRLTEEQVHKICKALEEGKTYPECCEAAGILNIDTNRNIICNIARGDRWKHISKKYNIKREMRDITDYSQYIRPVCELLETKMRVIDIIAELEIPGNYDRVRMFISGIKNHKTYTDISKYYNF